MSVKIFGGAYKSTNEGTRFQCDCGKSIDVGTDFISVYLVDYEGICTDGYETCVDCTEVTITAEQAKKNLDDAWNAEQEYRIEREEWRKQTELENKRARGEKLARENKTHKKAMAKHWKTPIANAFEKHLAKT